MQRLNSFLVALEQSGFITNSETYTDGSFHFITGSHHVIGQLTPRGFFISQNGKANRVITNKPIALLCREIASGLFGFTNAKYQDKTYQSVCVFPIKQGGGIVQFKTASGGTFAIKSSNTRVTLGLYDLLYAQNAEHSIMMLPVLWGASNVEVEWLNSSVSDFHPYFVSLKSSMMTKDCISASSHTTVKPSKYTKAITCNKYIGDFSNPGSQAPTKRDIIMLGKTFVYSGIKGHQVRSVLDFEGVTYAFASRVNLRDSMVKAICSSAAEDIFEMDNGVEVQDAEVLKALADLVLGTYEDITEAVFDTMDVLNPDEPLPSVEPEFAPILELEAESGSDFMTPDIEFEEEESVLDDLEEFDVEEEPAEESDEESEIEKVEARFKVKGTTKLTNWVVHL